MIIYFVGVSSLLYFIFYICYINPNILNIGIYNFINFINNYNFYLRNIKLKINNILSVEDKCISIIDDDGTIITQFGENEFRNLKICTLNNFVNKSILYEYTTLDMDDYKSYMLRFDSIYNVSDDFEKSNIKFLIPTINIKDNNDIIIDKFDMSNLFKFKNFYIVNNILFDKVFILWYLKLYTNYSNENINYHISFIDHKMDNIILSDGQSIMLDFDLYLIINN